MNVQEYIASGILEEYVLGTVSPQEKREVECLSGIYPEIKQELDNLSLALGEYASSFRNTPPPGLKEQIMSQLDFSPPTEETLSEEEGAPVRPLRDPYSGTLPTFAAKWAAVAAVGLFMLVFAYYLFSRLQGSQRSVAELRQQNETMQTEMANLRSYKSKTEQAMYVLSEPGARMVRLEAVGKNKTQPVTVLWNPRTGTVHLDMDPLNRPPEYTQYQLWAIVDGKPQDAGVLDMGDASRQWVLGSRNIQRAEAFAITVERRGGSPTPTLDAMVVMGKTGA